MKLFCAYAFTGEDKPVVVERMRLVVDELKKLNHDVYCDQFDDFTPDPITPKTILAYTIEKLKEYDAVVAIITSERRSEGQLLELGAGLAWGKPLYLVQHESAVGKSYLPELATKTVVWKTSDDLKHVLSNFI